MEAKVRIARTRAFDVVVCGGGPAGFCAAVAAAREGARTALLETFGMLGGTMTVGGINAPALFHAHGRQIISGIGWELMTALAAEGSASLPEPPFDAPHPLLAVELNAFQAAVKMDEMALGAGVTLCLRQQAVAVLSENGHVEAVLAASPEGLERIEGRVFIDCTGDADVCAMAGAAFERGQTLQPATLNFRVAGHRLGAEEIQPRYERALREGRLAPEDVWGGGIGALIHGRGRGREQCWAQNPGSNLNHVYPFDGSNAQSRAEGEIAGRRSIDRLMRWLRAEAPGYENAFVAACSPFVTARESRRVIGREYVTGDDYIRGACPETSVCYSFYPIDVHRGDTESALDNEFHAAGRVPGVPYGALAARDFDNLMMAGRNASGDRRAQSAFRVQASCMAMGQAAGTAAAMAVREGTSVGDVNVPALRERLAQRGAIVPEL